MKRITRSKLRLLRLPIIRSAGVRMAELAARPRFEGTQLFPAERWHELKSFAPQVLVGASADLQRLVERIALRTADLGSLDCAVFVLTEVGDKPLAELQRKVLWQRFSVPVYELYVGPNRSFLAYECEAQEGWHVREGVEFVIEDGRLLLRTAEGILPTGLEYELQSTPCACGRPGIRILEGCAGIGTRTEPLLAATA